ncbi:hypothetical protein CLV78_110132 [Aliiruegeria haliotis]|uniref:Uncharacterized protein n=1 Tax=Aliiruegeria haliotis TaxID=1280846 RepID=A0A2T0RJG7_9RHOB|nr:hypothetical protein [Aliiruegeria haliotis]PRY21257.1 hypothetical protein CLV78_110132 [Aliiruegeria haliotis]
MEWPIAVVGVAAIIAYFVFDSWRSKAKPSRERSKLETPANRTALGSIFPTKPRADIREVTPEDVSKRHPAAAATDDQRSAPERK